MAAPETIQPLGPTPPVAAVQYARSVDGGDSDAELLREAERGNGAAFEKIACSYHHAILALLLTLTGSKQAALDLCHSTLLAAYREMQRRRAQSMYVWFYRLASHQWIAWAGERHVTSASGTRAPACVDAAQDLPLADASAPADVLAALTARERLVFALKTNQRLALHTVAQILDLPEETVVRIFTRAVEKLRMAVR